MSLLEILINIQHWSQVLPHSFQHSKIPFHNMFLMENQVKIQQWYQLFSLAHFPLFDSTHSELIQKQPQKHLTISSSSNISCWYFMFLIYTIGGGVTRYLVPERATSVTSLTNSGLVLYSTPTVKSNLKLKLDNHKNRQTP